MYQPRLGFLTGILFYTVLIKVLPFLLMQFGMSISLGTTPYPWSLTPVLAVSLFTVGTMRDPRLGFGLPLAAWFLADLLIGGLVGRQWGWESGLSAAFYPGQALTYLGLLGVCACGLFLQSQRNWKRILGTGVVASTLFFLVTNFGSWYFDIGEGYSRDLSGLLTCYVAGIPFFRNYLLGTTLFSFLLFSPAALRELEASSQPELAPQKR